MRRLGLGGLIWMSGLSAVMAQAIVSTPDSSTTVILNVPLGASATVAVGLTGDGSVGQGRDHLDLSPHVGVAVSPSNDSVRYQHGDPATTPATPPASAPMAGLAPVRGADGAAPGASPVTATTAPEAKATAARVATPGDCVSQPAGGHPVTERLSGAVSVAVVWLCDRTNGGSQLPLLRTWPELGTMLAGAGVPLEAVVALRQERAGRLLVYAMP